MIDYHIAFRALAVMAISAVNLLGAYAMKELRRLEEEIDQSNRKSA